MLPFANIGGDPDQEYFVDGVTESPTTDLSRISGAFVIARNTAFTFKGKAIDVRKLGRELNVRYVLRTSILPPHWRTSVSWVKQALRHARVLSFIRVSRSVAIAPAQLATILLT